MALQGNIDSFSVVDVLRLLGSSAKSGRLVVDGDRGSGSLWMADGLVVAGTTTRSGATAVGAPPAEVLFDLLRFAEGAFVFEAGVEPTDLARSGAGDPIDVDAVIADSETSLQEWDDIVAVVPSLRTTLSLVLDLPDESVTVDRRTWSGVVAVAAGVEAAGDRTTVGTVAELLGLSELPAMRLVRDLVVTGLVEIGADAVEDAPDSPAFEHAPFEPEIADPFSQPFGSPFDTAADAAPFEPSPSFGAAAFGSTPFEPAGLDGVAHEAPAARFDAPPAYAPTGEPPAYEPADIDLPTSSGPADEVPAPIGNIGASEPSESFDAFAPFDPFGTAGRQDAAADAASGHAAEHVPDHAVDDEALEAARAAELDDAAQQAEFARQLAMLSPRAAEAVASAEAGPTTEDEERARVARFLGSV